jgi:hypothetical protein
VKIKQWIRDYLAGRSFERVESAIKHQAKMASEAEYHRQMGDWYTRQVDGIDPHTDWWHFAAMKQKEHDHLMEHHVYRQRADEAEQAANARMASA